MVAFTFGLVWVCAKFFPSPFLSETKATLIGMLVFLLGAVHMFRAARLFKKYATNIAPWQSTLTIIEEGPYRNSRNPIYLSFLVMSAGVACGLNAFSGFLPVALLYVWLRYYVIAREESYLTKKFGDAYLTYLRSRRRWL